MADSTKYQRIILKFSSPYARSGAAQVWSLKFSLSGEDIPDLATAAATALDMAAPPLRYMRSDSSFVGFAAYKAGSSVADFTEEYVVGQHPGTQEAYPTGGLQQQLEVCGHARVRIGTSSKGKATYLSKSIHAVLSDGSGGTIGGNGQGGADMFAEWNTGAGPAKLIPISPTTGAQPATPWVMESALYTRQLRKVPKGKA